MSLPTNTSGANPRDPLIIVDEMLDAIEHIRRYTQGMTLDTFSSPENEEKQDAVIRRFEILGEAATQLPPNLKTSHDDIPWRVITDMRNLLIHRYFLVNFTLMWDTIRDNIPDLEVRLRILRRDLDATSEQNNTVEGDDSGQ